MLVWVDSYRSQGDCGGGETDEAAIASVGLVDGFGNAVGVVF